MRLRPHDDKFSALFFWFSLIWRGREDGRGEGGGLFSYLFVPVQVQDLMLDEMYDWRACQKTCQKTCRKELWTYLDDQCSSSAIIGGWIVECYGGGWPA